MAANAAWRVRALSVLPSGMIWGMKVKTSVTISEELLAEIDRAAGKGGRSELIESLVRRHFRDLERERRSAREREILERQLASPDFESDVLDYSVDPFGLGDDVEVLDDDEPTVKAS